jgi:type IV secretion system protein VirB2
MPWDTPLTTLRTDLTGPVAFTLSLLAFFVAGVALVFGGEMAHFTRGMVVAVMVGAMLAGIVNVAAALGIAGAVIV